MKQMVKAAQKNPGEPLSPEDWAAYFDHGRTLAVQRMKGVLRSIPSSPRCGFCGAPFSGLGSKVLRPLGYRQSRKNPNVCDVCVEMAPPGGMTMAPGVLFADVRGFTALSERVGHHEAPALLHRFYACAERTLFPEALIDKLIGDEVMALYIPSYMHPREPEPDGEAARAAVAPVILEHARKLLDAVGYGSPEGPFLEVGIGLDYGDAFVGNVGGGAVKDFTAIGDVVNTASRLTGQAAGGEIVLSERLAAGLEAPPGRGRVADAEGEGRAARRSPRRGQLPPRGVARVQRLEDARGAEQLRRRRRGLDLAASERGGEVEAAGEVVVGRLGGGEDDEVPVLGRGAALDARAVEQEVRSRGRAGATRCASAGAPRRSRPRGRRARRAGCRRCARRPRPRSRTAAARAARAAPGGRPSPTGRARARGSSGCAGARTGRSARRRSTA